MFIRSKVVKGRTYYQVIEAYRDDGRPRQRTLASLGTHSTIEEARAVAWEQFSSVSGERIWGKPSTPDRIRVIGLWYRVLELDDLARRWHAQEGTAYQEDARIEAEKARDKAEFEERKRRYERDEPRRRARREAKDRKRDESFRDYFGGSSQEVLEGGGTREPSYHDLLTLGLAPTTEEIKAAYRRRSLECHPDKGGSDKAMAEINAAYERLLLLANTGDEQEVPGP
jgi:hypothetical protein